MQMTKIILSGERASGKSHIATAISLVYERKYVLTIPVENFSVTGMIKKIEETSGVKLIVFECCNSLRHIIEISNALMNAKNRSNISALIFTTQSKITSSQTQDYVIECNYNQT